MKKRCTALLLLIVMLVSMFPIVSANPKEADAGTMYIEGLGNVEIAYSGKDNYKIYLDENKNLIVTGTYFSNSTATLSYHTSTLYFATRNSGMNPGALSSSECYSVDVWNHDIVIAGNTSLDTYTVYRSELEEMIRTLYGPDGLKEDREVYLSEGFQLKKRATPSDEWECYGEVYDSVTGIRGAAAWSGTTKKNFENYYDIKIKLKLTKYSVTVESSEGGTAWSGQQDGMAYEGDTVKLSATAYDDYNFSGWEVVSGNIGSFDTSSANTSFTMPPSDVVVRATFREKEKTPTTKAPAPTRSPEATPTPGPTATPLPTAAPTATPIPVPYVETDILERHYTTDVGHYIGKMDEEGEGYFSLKAEDDYGFGYWANQDGVIGGGKITFHGDELYDFGTNGTDEWYFIPDDTNATYVHPKKYKGVIVDSENIKNITELTFPETITMNGTEYTVTSIGGGGDLYYGTAWSDTPEHFRYSDGGPYWGESTSITFGVIGNGAYQSYGSQSSSSVDVEYRNNYYFENTTLRYVTIPSTVTRIENYAFYLCQALEQIKGGEGLLSIGDCAFSSLDTVTAYQQSSGVKDINMSLKWYYYNCSKSTSVTPTITAWKTSVSLPHDLYMPTFPKLQLIESEAFCRRSNLSDVFLPNTLQEIESYAFEHCYLDSITIPSVSTVIFDNYDTLGTKGDGVKKKTLIITNPNSKAMEYGLEYELYYDLRAGYAVIYVKNSTPNETYSSNAMLKKQYANAVHTTENAHYTNDDEWQKEVYFLDENGGLFLKKNGTEAAPVLSGTKIESLKKCGYLVFAITTSGDVYELFHGATRKLSLPAGAHCFQFVGLENYYRDTLNTNGRGPYLVYFLNADGQICILDNSNRTGIIQGTYPSADTPYKFDRIVVETEGEPYGGFFGELYDEDGDVRSFDLAPQIVAHAASDSPYQPNSLVRFYAKYCGNKDASNVANSYQPPEEITSYSTPCFWIYNAFGYAENDYYGNELASYYIGDKRYEKMFGGKYTNYRGYEIYFATDTHFCQATYKLPNTVEMQNTHYPEERNGSYEITQLAEIKYGNAASSDYTVTDHQKTQFSTVEIDGKVYGFVRYKGYMEAATGRMYPIFDGEVKDTWEISGEVTNSEGDRHNYDAVYILGDDDNLYAFYVMDTRNYTVYPGYGKVVSNVDKIYKSGDNMFVLDKSGGLWAIGAETWYGPMGHSDAYSSTAPAMEWAFATKIEVTCYCNECKTTETITQFKDVYMETHEQSSWAESSPLNAFHYTLIESACGQTLAAGYNYSIFKDSENHPVFIPVDYAIPAQSSQAYRTGYVFEESLYDLMFDPAGREFVGWTLLADGSGSVYQPGTVLRITAPTSIYAKWDGEAKKKIQYIPNGGAGMMETDVYPADTPNPVTLQKNAFTRKGYEFTGWSYKQNPGSTDTIFRDEAQIVIAPGTTKLYAQWKPFTYTVKVGTEDMRVTGQSFTTHTMQLDTELTLGSKEAKTLTIYFHPNKQTSMSTTPVPNTVMSASASLSFYGWRLYEDTNGDGKILEEEDTYLGFYDAGATVKNLTSKKGMVLYIFPYWGGSASYVDIPEITCTGYDLVGYTPGTALAPDAYETADDRAEAVKNGELIMAPVGSNARYQPKTNGETLYAYYEAKTYEVKLVAEHPLAEEGEIIMNQTSAEMVYDQMLPNVQIPQSERFVFLGYYDKLDSDGVPTTDAIQYYDETGTPEIDEATGKPRIWTVADQSVTVLYAYFASETEVRLDGRGATRQEQTTVTMGYDEIGPRVIPPEKTGYTFEGYFTGVRGSGKRYYNATGECVAVWTEKRTEVLYAYWKQKPVEIPKKEEPEIPGMLPEERMEIFVALEDAEVELYADDKNPETGAETDVPPYQVEDTVRNGVLEQAGGIPSTEPVAARTKQGNWVLSCLLEQKSGTEAVRVRVTVPYRTQYENAMDESLVISEVQYETVEIPVQKAWAYWTLSEGGIYFPKEVLIRNDALEGGSVVIPTMQNEAERPTYRITSYGEKEEHIKWPDYDETGKPILSFSLTEVEYIVSEVPGELPDVEEYLTNVCYNAAWKADVQFSVKSDNLTVAGITLLPDEEKEDGCGAVPDQTQIAELKKRIDKTDYSRLYRDEIALKTTAQNGRYETFAEIVYTAADENIGTMEERRISVKDVNEINVHTPVVCVPEIKAEHEDMVQCERIPEGHTALVLDEEGIYSEFVLKIGTSGYHSDKKGYGENDYRNYLAQKDGIVQNEVCFPFPVWVNTGNDTVKKNDVLLKPGEWYVIGETEQRFYLPTDTKEGSKEICFRSVAVNGQGKEEKGEVHSNTQPANYAAEGTVMVYVTGRFYDFTVNKVGGTMAWEELKEEVSYSVGRKKGTDTAKNTLPLRTGGHPLYRNLGGLPMGGYLEFTVKSVGDSFGEGAVVKISPKCFACRDGVYETVDVYYEKEEENGVFLRKWEGEETSLVLTEPEEIISAVFLWNGRFTLPALFYAAETGTDVMNYQKLYGLSFTEEFWVKDVPLVLRFALTIENPNGERLYYGMIPERIENNLWQKEAKESYREDIDGNRFEIQGGEVAIIYPGDSAKEEDSTYGIY